MKAPTVRQCCIYWLPPLLLTGGILSLSGDLGSTAHTQGLVKWLLSWFSFLNLERMQDRHRYFRIGGHILAYASLYFLWFRAFRGHFSARPGAAILWSLGFCLLTSLADEGHQALMPSRHGSIGDVVLDLSAAALAALALSFKRI